MKGKLNTDLGQVLISPEVVAKYASETAYECFGIVGMAMVSMKDGLVRLLKRDSSTKGINVIIDEDNEITRDFILLYLTVLILHNSRQYYFKCKIQSRRIYGYVS